MNHELQDLSVVYQDNHIIIVSKEAGQIVQGDKTGDTPLSEIVKQYIKEVFAKPGNVFLGVIHRLDRPVSGLVAFARTSKALARMNKLFAEGKVQKTYLAIVANRPPKNQDTITGYLTRNPKLNKSYIHPQQVEGSKLASLSYQLLSSTDKYHLLQIQLHTGRHHQIRCQLASIGCPIRGDLKYGARRSNPDGSISLHAHRIRFQHPVSLQQIDITAPLPNITLWQTLWQNAQKTQVQEN